MKFLTVFAAFWVLLGIAFLTVLSQGSIAGIDSSVKDTFTLMGTIFVGVGVLLFLISMGVARSVAAGRRKFERLASAGSRAPAVITAVEDTGVTINDNPRIRISLRVQPSGGAPFDVRTSQTVSRIAIPRAGDTVSVLYNPADPQDFVIEGVTSPLSPSNPMIDIETMSVSASGTGPMVVDARNMEGLREAMLDTLEQHGIQIPDSARDGADTVVPTASAPQPPAAPPEPAPRAMDAPPPAPRSVPAPSAAAADLDSVTSSSVTDTVRPSDEASGGDALDRLDKLNALREKGAISLAEYEQAKARLLEEL
jgi:hypothetical protein